MDLYNRDKARGVKLYVKRVFIMDDAEALLPSYLRFIKGVVDSADLPLNVSRELLQESRDVRAIREGNTKRVLSVLENLAQHDSHSTASEGDVTDVVSEEDKAKEGKYSKFYAEFGAVLKEGLGEDFSNKERIAKLLRFASSTTDTVSVSFADYKVRMKEGQEAIYYITAETLAAAKNSPQLEVFKKKGIEVLLMTDRVDEWALNYLQDFDGTPLQSVAKGAVDLGKLQDEAEKKAAEDAAEAFKPRAGQAEGSAEGQGRGRARDHPPGGQPGLLGSARPRHEHATGTPAQAGRSERARCQAHPGSERRPRAGEEARRQRPFPRPGAHPV